jgi:hypothetical protein
MRVQSPLADIDFGIGAVRRDGDRLVFVSDETSSLDATVYMDARDAGRLIGALLKSPSAIGFALSLPFLWLSGGKAKESGVAASAAARHPFVELNKPW